MKNLFKVFRQHTVDIIILILTAIMFLGHIIEEVNVSKFLWIYVGYVTYTIIRKYRLTKILDEYIINTELRKKLGLPVLMADIHERATPIFSLIIQALIFIGGVAMLLYLLLDFTGIF